MSLAATSSQRCLLPIPIVGRIASVAILQRFNIIAHGYFNVLICPTAMATSICLATLASSQRCLLPIPIVGRIASVVLLPNGYFSDFILPIIILIRLVTLANNARCYFFMHSLKLLLLAGTSETLQIEQDNILGSGVERLAFF